MERGDTITTPGGAVGRYVGERLGLTWIAYEGDDFAGMCAAFDLWSAR